MTESPRWDCFVNLGDPSDVIWFDAGARLGRVPEDFSADRPGGFSLALTLEGPTGRTVVEAIPVRITDKFLRLWVRRLEGPWPTPNELVDCLMDGAGHFGATVDMRPGDIALVQVAID